MDVSDYLKIDNPGVFAVVVGVVLFAIMYSVVSKFVRIQKGTLIAICIFISGIASWGLYSQDFYGWEGSIVFLIALIVLLIFLKIIWSFAKFGRASTGRYYRN